jgi:hypothetical protein
VEKVTPCFQVKQQLATFWRLRWRTQRFEGAGGSATRAFNRQRRQNIRDDRERSALQ